MMLKQNKWFFIPYVIVLLAVVPVLLAVPKGDLHLLLNGFHNGFYDVFFRYLTLMGDGLVICSVGLVLLFFSLRNSLFIISAYLGTGFLVQVLKRLVFPSVMRPVKFFQDAATLHLVDGVKMLTYRSFPSGHAASAFAFFLCVAMISKNHSVKFLCFLLALLTAFSRVYLSQHFLVDIYAGSVIGVLGTIILYRTFFRSDQTWHQLNIISWMQRK